MVTEGYIFKAEISMKMLYFCRIRSVFNMWFFIDQGQDSFTGCNAGVDTGKGFRNGFCRPQYLGKQGDIYDKTGSVQTPVLGENEGSAIEYNAGNHQDA